MPRNYSAEYEARNEAAIERGFESYADERAYRVEAREYLSEHGMEMDTATFQDFIEFGNAYAEGDMSVEQLHDQFFDWFPDASDQDFYDWLDSLYE